MRDANITEEFVQVNILATPVSLNMNNFVAKETFNMLLELNENLKDIIFTLK
jgi:hypothetical protein